MCCYRDIKNFDRFQFVVQSMICLAIVQLKNIEKLVEDHCTHTSNPATSPSELQQLPQSPIKSVPNSQKETIDVNADKNESDMRKSLEVDGWNEDHTKENEVNDDSSDVSKRCDNITDTSLTEKPISNDSKNITCEEKNEEKITDQSNDEIWTLPEFEKLLILVAKTFLLNFPLYMAYKHAVHSRLEDISAQDMQNLSMFCDLHENEMPALLLRNVSLFCNTDGFAHLSSCFDIQNLPISTAHAITAIVSNIKLWFNCHSIAKLFIPIRSKILQYMKRLADQDLRSPATKSMADFMWSAMKDPLDTQIPFDGDGLALAFKYLTSSTLTMRLAGMAQINTQINIFNDICTSETVAEVEMVGQKLSDWLNDNKIINHLFGPNLHIELIKQSPIILRFLAVENQITEEHLNLIWQAAQLKHCSKAIYDVLPSLVKNLSLSPALYMYSLICKLDPKEHSEQSIFIASTLIKLIWSRDGARHQVIDLPNSAALLAATNVGSSSENSVSIDNSEEEHPDDDSSDGQKSTIDIEGGSDSGPPCKQIRHKNCCDETTDGKNGILLNSHFP